MIRHFVIGIDSVTRDQSDSIRKWLDEQQVSWWHWLDGVWLVVSANSDMNVVSIRDKVHDLAPKVHHLVLEVHPETWAGYGPTSEKSNMFTWLGTWDK